MSKIITADIKHNPKTAVQIEGLNSWRRARKGRGLLAMCTGSGKSKVAIDACKLLSRTRKNPKVWLLCPSTLLRDKNWPEEFKKWGMAGFFFAHVKADCYASVGKIPDQLPKYDLIIMDEAHNITERHMDHLMLYKDIPLIALTATPPTKSKFNEKAKLLHDLQIPVVYHLPLSEGVRRGIVADFDITLIQVDLEAKRKTVKAGKKGATYMTTEAQWSKVLDRLVAQTIYNEKATKTQKEAVIRKRMHFIYNLQSKMEAAKYVLDKVIPPTDRSLIFAGNIPQAEELCDTVYHSKSGFADFQNFVTKRINRLACIFALDEGHNIPDLDSALIVQMRSQSRQLIQRLGRVIREREGHKGKIYIIIAKNTVDEKWTYNALAKAGIDTATIKLIDFTAVKKGLNLWS